MIGEVASVDIATMENLKKLTEVGKDLLKKPLSRINLETGEHEPADEDITNEEALTEFAKMLSQERKLRMSP